MLAAPGYLAAAALAALVVVGFHLLAWRRPRPVPLPTARFAPSQAVRAASRELQLQDVALLALRVLALLMVGVALSRPSAVPAREGTARVIVADASRRVARLQEVRDAIRRAAEGSDIVSVVRVDSVARVVADTAFGERANARALLAAGLVAAVREGRRLSATAQRVELVVISPFARESWDSAAVLVRNAWEGEVRVVRVAATAAAPASGPRDARPGVPAADLPTADDPVGAAVARAIGAGSAVLRVRRDPPTAADSAWLRAGGVLVWWPRDGTAARDSSGTPRPALLAWDDDAAIGHFAPLGVPLPAGTVVARWGDGTPAVTESALGSGCLRTVAASIPVQGDEPLRPAIVRLAKRLAAPCGGPDEGVVDDATLAAWARGGAEPARSPAARPLPPSPTITRVLLLLAAALLLAEWWWRRQRTASASGGTGATRAPSASREAA